MIITCFNYFVQLSVIDSVFILKSIETKIKLEKGSISNPHIYPLPIPKKTAHIIYVV